MYICVTTYALGLHVMRSWRMQAGTSESGAGLPMVTQKTHFPASGSSLLWRDAPDRGSGSATR
jgi:hypothetical protein